MSSSPQSKRRRLPTGPIVLSICLDVHRTRNREQALSSAGFRVISVTTFEAALAVCQYCEFRIVVLDHECCSQLTSLHLEPPYVIFGREADSNDSQLVQDLLGLCNQKGRLRKDAPMRAA